MDEVPSPRDADQKVKVVTFSRNFGQIPASLAGFKAATGDAVISISAGLQDPVGLIPEIAANCRAGGQSPFSQIR